jgi:hypothetical protein
MRHTARLMSAPLAWKLHLLHRIKCPLSTVLMGERWGYLESPTVYKLNTIICRSLKDVKFLS